MFFNYNFERIKIIIIIKVLKTIIYFLQIKANMVLPPQMRFNAGFKY